MSPSEDLDHGGARSVASLRNSKLPLCSCMAAFIPHEAGERHHARKTTVQRGSCISNLAKASSQNEARCKSDCQHHLLIGMKPKAQGFLLFPKQGWLQCVAFAYQTRSESTTLETLKARRLVWVPNCLVVSNHGFDRDPPRYTSEKCLLVSL